MPRSYDSNYENLIGDFSFKYADTPVSEKFHVHVHDAYEVTLILSDDVELFINGSSYPVPRGSLLLFNTMDTHMIRYKGKTSYKRYVVWFKPEFLNELDTLSHKLLRSFFLRSFDKPNLLCLTEDELSETVDFYNRLDKLQSREKKDRLILALAEFLVYVNELYVSKNENRLPINYNEYGAIYKAILYIQENYASDLTRKTLSTLTGINERTLCDHFRSVTGMTTNQYILTYRLSVAKNLLMHGMQATAVAEKTGFDNYCNFSRTFKNHVGISPKQYAMSFSSLTGDDR